MGARGTGQLFFKKIGVDILIYMCKKSLNYVIKAKVKVGSRKLSQYSEANSIIS